MCVFEIVGTDVRKKRLRAETKSLRTICVFSYSPNSSIGCFVYEMSENTETCVFYVSQKPKMKFCPFLMSGL